MKKTIFVTLDEFIQNGGELEKGREIYIITAYPHQQPKLTGHYLSYDKRQKTHLVENNSYKSKPVSDIVGYVQIEVTPIYK